MIDTNCQYIHIAHYSCSDNNLLIFFLFSIILHESTNLHLTLQPVQPCFCCLFMYSGPLQVYVLVKSEGIVNLKHIVVLQKSYYSAFYS